MATHEIRGIREELDLGLFRVSIELHEMVEKVRALLLDLCPEETDDPR